MKNESLQVVLVDTSLLLMSILAFLYLKGPIQEMEVANIFIILALIVFVGVIITLLFRIAINWRQYKKGKSND